MKLLCLALLNWALALVTVAQSAAGVQATESPLSDSVPDSSSLDIGGEVSRERLPENWSDADVFGLRTFAEPLVAESKAASEQERAAFSRAINNYLADGQPESLESFLRGWPESRWAGAIEHNLGLLKYRDGHFTAAIGCWESAWNRLKDSKDARLHALANQSLAELARMDARLGRIESLKPLLGVLKEREVGGSARQMLDTSSDALHEMEARPDQSFKCGPYALADVRKALGIPDALAPAIREIKSPYRGFALAEISQLATTLGMPNQMAKWSDAFEIPAPSVVNWKRPFNQSIKSELRLYSSQVAFPTS